MPEDNITIDVTEPEVFEAVKKEIEQLGSNVKEQYDKLQNEFKNLQDSTGEKADQTKLARLEEAITTRQESIDNTIEKINKRIDTVEVSMKRPGGIITDVNQKDIDDACREWYKTMCINKGNKPTWNMIKNYEPNHAEFNAYKAAFKQFLFKDDKYMSPEDIKALSVGVDPDGGYTVTPEMSNQIIEKIYETDPIRQLANIESISTDAFEQLVDWGQFGVGWEGETQTGDETSTGDLNKKRIPVHIMYAKPRATQQLIEDSAINIEAWISAKVAKRMGRYEGAAFVEGDGIGKPRGFLTYDSGTSYGQVEQVNMGAAAALTADGFFDVKYALLEDYQVNGTWLMARGTLKAALQLKDGMGNYLWSPGLAEDKHSTLLSNPVRLSTTMPAIAANALSVAFADWSEAYTIVDRLGISVQRDPFTVKPFIEFYTRKRVGGDVVNYDAIKIGKISA